VFSISCGLNEVLYNNELPSRASAYRSLPCWLYSRGSSFEVGRPIAQSGYAPRMSIYFETPTAHFLVRFSSLLLEHENGKMKFFHEITPHEARTTRSNGNAFKITWPRKCIKNCEIINIHLSWHPRRKESIFSIWKKNPEPRFLYIQKCFETFRWSIGTFRLLSVGWGDLTKLWKSSHTFIK